ncbi:MAG: cysteine peptidase family C39 domain-containing protein [Romboutsia sp.]
MSKYFCVRQEEAMDCGLASLSTILLYYNKPYSLDYLKKNAGYNDKLGTNFFHLYSIAINLGFKATALTLRNTKILTDIKLPCIAQLRFSTETMHFVVIYKVKRNIIIMADPAKGFRELSCKTFSKCFTNKVLLIYQKGDMV